MTSSNSSKKINIALWIVQSLLAAIFVMAGANKLFQPIPELAKMLPWVTSVPLAMVKFIGLSELLGGMGMLLPSLLRIKPVLTAYAALGIALVMIFATIFHISRGEVSVIGINFVFMAMATFVAWGRMKKVLITPKS